jgi:NarL family two-component system response regulator LiaR
MEEENVIRVLIVDDHLVVRQGFSMFLQASDGIQKVGEAANGQEAVQQCEELQPEVVLMDMVMPVMDGIEATRIIRSRNPHIQVIALTSFGDDKQLVQNALSAGALSFLFKDISVEELASAIRLAKNGVPVLSPEATRILIQSKTQRNEASFNLSPRELEVLKLLVQGLSNQQIAEQLALSRSTIKFHVSSILGKLGASTRTEAVSIALQKKLIT